MIFGYEEEPEARRRREWEVRTLAVLRREARRDARREARREDRREGRSEEGGMKEIVGRRVKTRAR